MAMMPFWIPPSKCAGILASFLEEGHRRRQILGRHRPAESPMRDVGKNALAAQEASSLSVGGWQTKIRARLSVWRGLAGGTEWTDNLNTRSGRGPAAARSSAPGSETVARKSAARNERLQIALGFGKTMGRRRQAKLMRDRPSLSRNPLMGTGSPSMVKIRYRTRDAQSGSPPS